MMLDLPFKLIISLIVVGVLRLKNQERGNQNPNNKHGGLRLRGQFHARRKGAGVVSKYLKNGRNGREDVEGKTKSTRNVVEEERLCWYRGGTSLLIRSLGRVEAADWLIPGDKLQSSPPRPESRDDT